MRRAAVAVVVAGLLALPACDKKKKEEAVSGTPAPEGYKGSKDGPPGGYQPPRGEKGGGATDWSRVAGLPPGDAAGKVQPEAPAGRPLTTGWDDQRVAAARQQSNSNLKQIALAALHYHDRNGSFPAGVYGADGKTVGLSWRVAILPYIEQDALYRQFKLNEAWDSEHNKKLLDKMPKVFLAPGQTGQAGHTFYRGFTEKGMLFAPPQKPGAAGTLVAGVRMQQIVDGTSNTAMVVEAGEAVPWTKPDELAVDPKKPLACVGGVFEGGFHVVRCDGSTTFVKKSIDGTTLQRFALIADGNVVNIP